MAKKPNASQFTHAMAQLGGGSKKDGGDGMMGGLENIVQKAIQYGYNQSQLEKPNIMSLDDIRQQQLPQNLEDSEIN